MLRSLAQHAGCSGTCPVVQYATVAPWRRVTRRRFLSITFFCGFRTYAQWLFL